MLTSACPRVTTLRRLLKELSTMLMAEELLDALSVLKYPSGQVHWRSETW